MKFVKKKNLNRYSKLNKQELIQLIQNDNKKIKISKIKNKFQKGGEKLILTDKNIKKAVKLWFENKDRFEKIWKYFRLECIRSNRYESFI